MTTFQRWSRRGFWPLDIRSESSRRHCTGELHRHVWTSRHDRS